MRSKRFLTTALLVALALPPARAETPNFYLSMTVSEFLALCRTDQTWCHQTVAARMDDILSGGHQQICSDKSISNDEAADAMIGWLRANIAKTKVMWSDRPGVKPLAAATLQDAFLVGAGQMWPCENMQ